MKVSILKFKNKMTFLKKDGFFHILFGNTLNKMIAFITSIVIVRLVSKAEYGYLSYADNLYSYINLFAGLGVSTAILKFCSPEKAAGENKFFLELSLKIGGLFKFVLSLILIIYIRLHDIVFPQARSIIYAMVLYPFLIQIETTIQSYVRSMLENKLYAKMGVVQTVVAFICSIIFALFIGVEGIVLSRYIAIISAIIVALKFIKICIPPKSISVPANKSELKQFWKISLSLMVANFFSMVMPINEMFLINNMIKDEIVTANYKVAILIPSQLTFIANSIIIYIFPKIAQIGNRKEKLFWYVAKTEILLFFLILIVSIVGMVLTRPIVYVVYGNKYEDAIELSVIYWVVYGINAGIRMLPMNILPAIGVTIFNSVLSIITCMMHAVLLFCLILKFNIYGAAVALIIVYLTSGILYWCFLLKYCYKGG